MEEILYDCLFPVMLGSNTLCHACVRKMEKKYGVPSFVLTGRRALTLRYLPSVTLVNAAPTLPDEILLSLLREISEGCVGKIPLLILCDKAYGAFLSRCGETLESYYIVRDGAGILGEEPV